MTPVPLMEECLESGGAAGEFPTLPRAPITEALIDIRVSRSADVTVDHLSTFSEPFQSRFSEVRPRLSSEAAIKFEGENAPVVTSSATHDGYYLKSASENLVAQATLDGFTFSKLKPYDSWATFCPQFVELWYRYLEVARPLRIKRVALRYINTIELPVGVDFKEYLLTIPEIAPGIPQTLPSFLMRLVIPSPSGIVGIVTETVGNLPPSKPGVFPLIFDIDVYREI